MKAVQVLAPGKAEFVETPIPELTAGYALIRPLHLSLCGSDINMLHYFTPDRYPLPPGTTGHEMVGIVEAIGRGESHFKVGDVTLTIAPDHRAMAEYYLAPFKDVIALPQNVPLEHLLQAQQLGTVIYACQRLPNIIAKDVVVIGQGSAGLWFATMLKRLGARKIIAIDLQQHRLALSQQYGATHMVYNEDEHDAARVVAAVAEITQGEMADVVVEAAGEPASINLTLELVKEYGFILQFGVPRADQISYHYRALFFKSLQLQSIVHAAREEGHRSTVIALEMIANGEVNVAPLLTHRFPFERVLDAYELQNTRDEGAVKIIIDMPTIRLEK